MIKMSRKPLKLLESITRFLSRTPVASPMTSAEWAEVPAQVRDSSVWSAQQTSLRFVQTFRNLIGDYLAANTETAANGEQKIAVGGRAEFVRRMQEFIEVEGIPRTGHGIQDIKSSSRLKLIFDVNTKSAENFGYFKAGLDPAILLMWPGRRFFRIRRVKVPRPVHAVNVGAVRRKDDMRFWLAMNALEIGGFGVPWGPWGYNSGCADEDVSRSQMVAMGLMGKRDIIKMPRIEYAQSKREISGVDDDLARLMPAK